MHFMLSTVLCHVGNEGGWGWFCEYIITEMVFHETETEVSERQRYQSMYR